jgi:hypothetical protein
MNSETDLLNKLMISKKIMEKHNDIGRGQARNTSYDQDSYSTPMLESYEAPAAKYNIPQEFMQEQQRPVSQTNSNLPMEDRITNSKLPDEIKRLMLEHPIQQPTMGMASGAVLSEELVEKASRLMNNGGLDNRVQESKSRPQPQRSQQVVNQSFDINEIKEIVRETVQDVLYENGLLVESTKDSTEMFKFRVGQHIFEGKVLKVRKISK